jgi:glycosyltransferase involved in cell wall biosynthesis
VLSAGRLWDEAKNVAALDAVAQDLTWPVYVAGDNAHAGDATPVSNVQMLGRLPQAELKECMARAAIYALPARYEPFGLSILEAALSGCALVIGDIATLREIWGDAALFVAPDDHEALRAALQSLMEDADLRQQMANRALQRATEYSTARMAQHYFDLYQELCRTHS